MAKKCEWCGKSLDYDGFFCSTKCKVELEQAVKEGKAEYPKDNFWLFVLIRNWKIVLIILIFGFVYNFFNGSKNSNDTVNETTDTTSSSNNTPPIDSSTMVTEEPPVVVEETVVANTKYLQFDNDGYFAFLKYDNNNGTISNATFECLGQEPFCYKLNVVQNQDSLKFYIEEEFKDNYFESFYGVIDKSDYVLILYNNETGIINHQLKEYMGTPGFVSEEKYKEVVNENQK